jgi:2-dehydropantoate 2-reductase
MELDALYGELLRLAAEVGCSLPKIEAMLDQLKFIQARYLTNE